MNDVTQDGRIILSAEVKQKNTVVRNLKTLERFLRVVPQLGTAFMCFNPDYGNYAVFKDLYEAANYFTFGAGSALDIDDYGEKLFLNKYRYIIGATAILYGNTVPELNRLLKMVGNRLNKTDINFMIYRGDKNVASLIIGDDVTDKIVSELELASSADEDEAKEWWVQHGQQELYEAGIKKVNASTKSSSKAT